MAVSSTQAQGDTISLDLDDYSSFQYMLASPRVARAVVDRTTSFVMYNEPRDLRRMESEHAVLVRGTITVLNYYCCCLALVPSHVLGMSRWISAEDCQSKVDERAGKTTTKKKLKPGDALRRFRYSFYFGLLHVETHHVFEGYANNGAERFRVVEYFDCPISPWVIMHAAFASLGLLAVHFLQTSCGLFVDTSRVLGIAVGLILMHSIYMLTGVRMSW